MARTNTNVDVQVIAQYVFLEIPSSGTLSGKLFEGYIILKRLWARKPNMTINMGYGHLCLSEEIISINHNYMI